MSSPPPPLGLSPREDERQSPRAKFLHQTLRTDDIISLAENACTAAAEVLHKSKGNPDFTGIVQQIQQKQNTQDDKIQQLFVLHEQRLLKSFEAVIESSLAKHQQSDKSDNRNVGGGVSGGQRATQSVMLQVDHDEPGSPPAQNGSKERKEGHAALESKKSFDYSARKSLASARASQVSAAIPMGKTETTASQARERGKKGILARRKSAVDKMPGKAAYQIADLVKDIGSESQAGYETQSRKKRHSAIVRNKQKNNALDYNQASKAKVFGERRFRKRDYIARLVHTQYFELFIIVLIIINSATIGASVNHVAMNGRDAPMPAHLVGLEATFCIVFTIELGLRIIGEGRNFVSSQNWHFHLLDTIIVISALVEQAFLIFELGGDKSGNMDAFAALRIIRLIRVARSVRVMEFSRDLRALVHGMLYCLKPLFWAIILLKIIMFMFCVVLMEFAVDYFTPLDGNNTSLELYQGNYDPSMVSRIRKREPAPVIKGDTMPHIGHPEELRWYFGSLSRGLFTLFKAISGGQNWGEIAEPLKHISWSMLIFFCIYIGIIIFAVLNIVMSIFIENARKNAQRDKNNLIWEEIQERNWRTEALRAMFTRADLDESNELEYSEFIKHFDDPIVQAFFRTLGLDFENYNMETLFEFFDYDERGRIDADTFVAGCIHLRGSAKSIDMQLLLHENMKFEQRLMELMENMKNVEKGIESEKIARLTMIQKQHSNNRVPLSSEGTSADPSFEWQPTNL